MTQAILNSTQRAELEQAQVDITALMDQQAKLAEVGLGDTDLAKSLARNKARLDVLLNLDND